MKKLILRNFYTILSVTFSMLSGIIIGIVRVLYKYPDFNYMIASKNDISILILNTLLVVLGIISIVASLYYYRATTKEDRDIPTTDGKHSSIYNK